MWPRGGEKSEAGGDKDGGTKINNKKMETSRKRLYDIIFHLEIQKPYVCPGALLFAGKEARLQFCGSSILVTKSRACSE